MRARKIIPLLSFSILPLSIVLGTGIASGQPPIPGSGTDADSPVTPINGHDTTNHNKALVGAAVPGQSHDQIVKGAASMLSTYQGSWRMFLQNPCHTALGTVNAQFLPKGKAKWTFPAEGPIDSSPAIYKGVVYVGSDDFFLYAIDERSGRMLWHTQLGNKVKSSPAVTNETLVVGCEDNKVYGIDPKTGSIKWTISTGDRVSSSPVIHDGVAYLGSWDGHVYALNISTGAKLWIYPKEGEPVENGAVGSTSAVDPGATIGRAAHLPNGSTSTIANGAKSLANGSATAANGSSSVANGWSSAPNGSTTNDVKGIGRITGSPALAPGMVVVAAHDGYVYCLDAKGGHRIWRYRTGNKILGSPMIMNGVVYFGSWDKYLYAVDAATGLTKWKFAGTETFSISPTGANGKIFAGNDDHWMYCLNADTGKLMWKTLIFSPVPLLTSSPAVGGSMLFCGSPDTNLYAIDTRNGAIKWKFKTQRPIISSPAISNDGICVGSQDGNLYLIN